jgi:hypothetical protein
VLAYNSLFKARARLQRSVLTPRMFKLTAQVDF